MRFNNYSTLSLHLKLFRIISRKRKIQLTFLILLMIFASFAEVISIGAVFPFLKALSSPKTVYENQHLNYIFNFFGISNYSQILFPLTLFFCVSIILSAFMRMLLLWFQTRLSHSIGADFSLNLYRRTLYQPYEIHLKRNSSDIIEAITGKTAMVINASILPITNILISLLMLIMVLVLLLSINPEVVLISTFGIGSVYVIIMAISKKRISEDSKKMNIESVQVRKALQEGLGGIRDVLLDGVQELYCLVYRQADIPLRNAQANIAIIGGSPRFIIEAIGMILIAILSYMLSLNSKAGSFEDSLPTIGALALGAQRMLPILQQLYGSWTSIKGGESSLKDAIDLIEKQPLPDFSKIVKDLTFQKSITLRGINFSYKNGSPSVLNDIYLEIKKGTKIGIIGSTGSGKSTLLDILMGLLIPTTGEILIDNTILNFTNIRSWQKHIAHVPQNIFLSDTTIAENIAFGIPFNRIDIDKVKIAAKKAQLSETIEKLELGYFTNVGERGVRLSGGQRQRIAIARALYKNADVIIFDEATSALDSITESNLMKEIETLKGELTIIIVAHRISTLKNCDIIIQIENGNFRKIENYNDLILTND
jgi:ABC-type multidrug transport system fused ATPase/permease subunit